MTDTVNTQRLKRRSFDDFTYISDPASRGINERSIAPNFCCKGNAEAQEYVNSFLGMIDHKEIEKRQSEYISDVKRFCKVRTYERDYYE
tara:strand:- start:247 stop:513 length:267 start_codon:yes stop_codon:yes gene_type:complete